jgi:alpha/beta superfamily hydrolase
LQALNKEARVCWIAGVSFGAWISMQLLMRRPEISGFISIAPLAKHYDFSFLAPCPASGLFVNGERDSVTSPEAVNGLVTKLKTQRGITIEHKLIPGANHFFQDKIDDLIGVCGDYLDRRLELEG